MRLYISVLAAAAVTVAGALASFSPAQAVVIKAAPAAAAEFTGSGAELVHKRRYRQDGRNYRRYGNRRNNNRYYGHRRRHYQPYAYYDYPRYYRRPGVTFQFGFGGSGYNGYGY